jgi:DNA-binding HxlR family transcriptional regulator
LNKHLTEAKTTQFTALDIRKEKPVHPRTLNRYLQELKLFGYVQVVGGNKHRGGFIYKLTGFGNQKDRQSKIQQSIDETLKNVWSEYENKNGKQKNQKPETNDQKPINKPSKEENKTIEPPQSKENRGNKRVRIEEKEKHTLKIILELEKQEPEREYLPSDLTTITKRSYYTESRHLKTLWEQGKLNREWKNRQYHYTLIKPTSKTVSQKPMTDTQSPSS